MKLTKDDYKKAIAALRDKHIVNSINNTEQYQHEFSGYFSSFGPDMNNGILTAIALYEGKPGAGRRNDERENSGQNRNKVCKVLLNLVKVESENITTLYEWAAVNLKKDKALAEYKLDKAIVSCKVALRLFKEIKNN